MRWLVICMARSMIVLYYDAGILILQIKSNHKQTQCKSIRLQEIEACIYACIKLYILINITCVVVAYSMLQVGTIHLEGSVQKIGHQR